MRPVQATAIRTALRPAHQHAPRIIPTSAQARLASTGSGGSSSPGYGSGPGGDVGDKGTAKVYNKDGTDPNKKNLVYLGLGALGLGGVYAMFMAKPEKVAEKAQGTSSSAR
ncbi:hypothetical protein C7999DRAFT_35854 [Corynascus novoguineensis]|uniref:Uncharacterized protein n=1 Tax=Corynascus novoguineensis TaxID=1126955 RepID=A0AAN7HBK7_9PEZI|nr:hypothetical protein C7999DRAFT_35854 [Corynascus novoguineensis]